jgi:hypothetical protein
MMWGAANYGELSFTGTDAIVRSKGSGVLRLNYGDGTGGVHVYNGGASDGPLTVGAAILSGALTYGGLTFNAGVTGSGNLVGSNAPSLASATLTGVTTVTESAALGWALDFSNSGIAVPAAPVPGTTPGTAALAAGSGLVVLADDSNGDVGAYLVGGAGVVFIGSTVGGWVATTTNPASGKYTIAFSGSAYQIYNGGSAFTARVMLNRVRASI